MKIEHGNEKTMTEQSGVGEGVSVYIHIPFCARKCPYCHFHSVPVARPPEEEYLGAITRELSARKRDTREPVISIYFGGGTPSLLSPKIVGRMIETVRSRIGIAADAEITLEANPGTVTPESLSGYRRAGVNRLSLGAQSFDDRVLTALGRLGCAHDARAAFLDARKAGFDNISLDLMFGVAARGPGDLDRDIKSFLNMSPDHISAYGLTVYDDTPFGRLAAEGSHMDAGEDAAADEYDILRRDLTEAGYDHYEIANFAGAGRRSRHNEHYWARGAYLGLGAGAVSFLREADAPWGMRFENTPHPAEYLRRAMADDFPRVALERMSRDEALSETLFLGMRRLGGVSLARITAEYGLDPAKHFQTELAELSHLGLIEIEGDALRLTPRGLFLSDEVFCRFAAS